MHLPGRLTAGWVVPALLAAATLVRAAAAAPPVQETRQQTEPIEQQISRLIEQLGAEDYFLRLRAQEELAKFSFEAFDLLTEATTHEDLEIAARAKYLLRLLQVDWTTEDDPPEVKTLLKDYRHLDTATKLARIRGLAGLPDRKGISALCRLVRFEKSLVLSKQAAIGLLDRQPHAEPPDEELAEVLREELGGSRRTAANWLWTWLRFGDGPEAVVGDWTKLVEAEYSLLAESPTKTSPGIVAKLVRFQIQGLKRLGRSDQVLMAMDRLIDLESGNAATLTELLDWLVEQKAWPMVEKLERRFAAQFAENPILLYTVAQAQAEQGDGKQAEATARRALELNPGEKSTSLRKHYLVASKLRDRGLYKWAGQEYRRVIDSGTPGSLAVVAAQALLAEMLHDRGEELPAAKVMESMTEALRQHPNRDVSTYFNEGEKRSRMNYFFACHWKNQKDPAKQREYLDKAIAADAADVDVLIACYRLADQTPEYREKTLRLIKKAADEFRQQITSEPDSSTPYNQLAWLAGNTEGDFDEALRCSKKSIELNPGYGGYYDTLAHVYFGKGDYENAVKTQTKAAELEPHSGLIARQLEVFRKKLEETRNKKR